MCHDDPSRVAPLGAGCAYEGSERGGQTATGSGASYDGGFEAAHQQDAENDALDRAAYQLFQAAGRPDTLWTALTHHEKEAWRHCARLTLNAYHEGDNE